MDHLHAFDQHERAFCRYSFLWVIFLQRIPTRRLTRDEGQVPQAESRAEQFGDVAIGHEQILAHDEPCSTVGNQGLRRELNAAYRWNHRLNAVSNLVVVEMSPRLGRRGKVAV